MCHEKKSYVSELNKKWSFHEHGLNTVLSRIFYFIVKLYYIQKAIIRVIKMLCDLIQKLLVLICPVIAITKSCHVTHVHGNRPGNCPCNHLLRAIMHSSEYIGSLVTLFKVRRSSVALT